MKEEERSNVMDSAKSVLFNLNTIESIMLVSTIMVNLAGIMLLSGQFENLDPEDEFQRDIITYTIILVISASFFILFCSLVREIRLARRLSKSMARARWRAAIRKQIAINKKKRAAVKRFQNVVHDLMRKNNVGKANHVSYLQPKKAPAQKPEQRKSLSIGSALKMKGMFRKHSLRKFANVGVEPVVEDTPPNDGLQIVVEDAPPNDVLQISDPNWLVADNEDVSVSSPFAAFIFPPPT
jgi:hypothetical protein